MIWCWLIGHRDLLWQRRTMRLECLRCGWESPGLDLAHHLVKGELTDTPRPVVSVAPAAKKVRRRRRKVWPLVMVAKDRKRA